jgi:hypothetical protein
MNLHKQPVSSKLNAITFNFAPFRVNALILSPVIVQPMGQSSRKLSFKIYTLLRITSTCHRENTTNEHPSV